MLGGSSILRLVCLLSFLWPHVASLYRTIYTDNLRRGQAGRGLKRNAFYSGYHRTNYSWLPKMNRMALSSNRKNKWGDSSRRQDIYDGSDFDWEGFPAEDTPTWPPDYNSWPQTATQAPPQVLPQYPPLVPTQAPLQGPYQVPPVIPTQMSVPVVSRASPSLTVPQARPAYSTSQAQIWPSRVKPQNDLKMPLKLEARNASRVCSPGPPLSVNPLFRNCLVIGDSISLGYLTTVKGELKGLCQVQHAPFAKGSGAVDSRYGLQCLSMMLHTTALEPTSYDAVVFNFGMHDIDYSKLFPEEFVPLEEYGENLMKIKELLLQSGAQVAFALTTPVPIAGRRNKRVVKYNKEARRVMEDGRKIDIVDLHSAVIHECGEPPYETCSIMKRPRDVHFNPKGNRLLGVKVGAAFRSLLSKARPRGQFSPPKAPELSAREGLASSYLHDDSSTFCPDMVTRCPTRTTCCENLLSLTGYGCCMEPDAVNCADNWHCCPRGTHCSPDCNFRSCKCLFPSFHPAAAPKLSKEENEGKSKSKSHSESHSTSGKVSKEFKGKKEEFKAEMIEKKKNKAKDTSATKSRKKAGGKSKHQLKLKDKKNKKHKQRRKDKGRKKTKKSRSKAKDKGGKSEKLKKFKKTKAIHKINRHVVKAHRTYQQNNFHPTTKQHWVTLLDDRLGAVTKHKPNLKFSHTWGKRKHQKLSFKSNGKKKKVPQTDASMADELKHLIVKHRKEKLRKRLKLPINGHTKNKHNNHRNGFIHRRKSTTKKKKKGRTIYPTHTRNVFKHHISHSYAKNKDFNGRKTHHEVKAANKGENNKSRHEELKLGHQNRDVNVFNNLRQTLHEKVLARKNISLGLNPSTHNVKIAEHFATKTSDNKTDTLGKTKADTNLASENATDSSKDFQRTSFKAGTSSSIDKNETQPMNTVNLKEVPYASSHASDILVEHLHNSTKDSSKDLQKTSFKGRTSSNSDKNESQHMNTVNFEDVSDPSSNAFLVKHLRNSNSNSSSVNTEGEPSNFVVVNVSNVVTKEARTQPQIDERESRTNSSVITKSNSAQSGIDERTAGENQNSLVNGKSNHGTRQHNRTLASISTKMASSSGTESVPLVKGMHNQASADWVVSGSGLGAEEFSTESASGVKTASTFSGYYDDSSIDEHIKVLLGGEDTESSTIDLQEKNESTNRLPSVDSSLESSTNEGEGSYKSSPWKSLNAESADEEGLSGSSFETSSSESGSDFHFGGEDVHGYGENLEYGGQKYFHSSGIDDIYQSGLFPLRARTRLNQLQKLKAKEDDQNIKQQNEDSSSDYSLSNDISQTTYNDWDDSKETYSGLRSGHYESSTDQWGSGSGDDGFSSESLSTDAKPISSSNHKAAKTLNIANYINQSSGDSDEESKKNEMATRKGTSLEKRNNVFPSNASSRMQLSEEKKHRRKSLRQKDTVKAKDIENNEFLSWEDRELKQLLYWLSTANDGNNRDLNKIMAYKDTASGHSRLHSMVRQKIFPHFSKSERDESKRRNGKEEGTFRPNTPLVSSVSGSGTEFSGDAENEADNEFKDAKKD